jgi:DNA mismatch repair protein MutS2
MITREILDKLEFNKVIKQVEKYCVTESGRSAASGLTPLTHSQTIVKTAQQVNEAKEILIKNDVPPLEYLPELSESLSLSRIDGTILTSRQILDILRLAEISRKLYQFIKPKEGEKSHLQIFCNELLVDKVFEHQISRVFLENGDMRDDASPELREIRIQIREKETALRKQVQRLLKQLSDSYLVQEEYVTQRDGRIVLPVKAEHKRHVKGFVHSESSTGQTVYIEPEETLELNNEILSLGFAEKREIERILKTLTARIGLAYGELRKSLKAVAELDSLFARARYSIEILGEFPSFEEEKPFTIIEGRHPLLLKRIGRNNTVPMDLSMDDVNIVLITGPNAGGKTVTLKTTGLLVCLALAGIPVPVHPDSNFKIFSKVLVDIGDAQSIEDDLSTFSSHLKNIKQIIDESDKNALVLLDEVGTGTDPAEGAAIASGMLITLRDKGARVLATTHHGSLKVIADQLEKFQNASMEFDTEHLKPTYRFKQGMPGSSYAFEVANRIGFDGGFISLAKEYLDTDKTKIEDFLISLEKKSRDLKDQLNASELENSRLKGLTNLYQDKIEKLEEQKKLILAETKERAENYLNDVNKKVETAIKNIRESQAQKEVIREEKKRIEEIKKESIIVFKKERKQNVGKIELKRGDYALIKGTTSVGLISELDINRDKAMLQIGTLKIKTRYSDLLPAKKSDESNSPNKVYKVDQEGVQYRLDLRGKRADEAELEILKFLDGAYVTGTDRVEILHGKGTGALKQLVQGILRNHHSVKDFHFADIEFGGDGITIVEFK